MSTVHHLSRHVKHPVSNGIRWPRSTLALFRALHVSAADLTFWARQDRVNTGFSITECQLIYIAWADDAAAGRTPATYMGCPLDAIWVWYWRKTGYLRPGYEWLREDRRRAA